MLVTIIFLIGGLLMFFNAYKLIVKQDIKKINYSQVMYVKENDIKEFTKQSGIAVLILGIFLIIFAVTYNVHAIIAVILLVIGFVIYVSLLLKVQNKYNIEPQKFDHDL